MILTIYSVRDARGGFFHPTVEQNDAIAYRNFINAKMVDDSVMKNFSKDFDLYKVGSFDTQTGKIESCLPEVVVDASSNF